MTGVVVTREFIPIYRAKKMGSQNSKYRGDVTTNGLNSMNILAKPLSSHVVTKSKKPIKVQFLRRHLSSHNSFFGWCISANLNQIERLSCA